MSEKTKIGLSVVITLLLFSSWLTQIYAQGNANASAIIEMKIKQNALETIAVDIAVIKNELRELRKDINRLER